MGGNYSIYSESWTTNILLLVLSRGLTCVAASHRSASWEFPAPPAGITSEPVNSETDVLEHEQPVPELQLMTVNTT